MPLGAFRTGYLGAVAAAGGGEPGGTYRTAVNVTAYSNAQIDNTTYNVGSGSVVLDGTGDYLGTDFAHPDMTEFTFECWFNISTLKDNMHLWMGDNGVSNARHQIWITGPNRSSHANEVIVATGSGGSYTFNVNFGSTTWATNTWYHLAVTRNSSNSITVWVNGVSKGSATDSKAFFSSSASPLIGAITYDANAYFDGYIDEIRISSTCRYTTGFTPDTAGFSDDANTLMLLHLDTDFSDDNSFDTGGGEAIVLDGVAFDTDEHYYKLDYDGTGTTDNKEVTISFWFNSTYSAARSAPFAVRPGGTRYNAAAWLWQDGEAKMRFYIQTPNLTYNGISTETNLYTTSDGWHHAVFSCDFATAGSATCYVDGVEVTMTSNSTLAENIDWNNTASDIYINGRPTDDNEMNLAQVFIDNKYYDLSTNLDKFYSSGAIDMGTDGTSSGLTQPLIYHYGNTSTFPTNSGTWSYSLTATGTPSDTTTS